MKKLCFCILSTLILLLTSCKNFMNAGDVQKEIEGAIKEANAKTCKLVISQDTTMGSFLSSGEKECKLGYSIQVQFNLKKEAYIFKGLKAVSTSNDEESRNDFVEFSILERDDEKGIYKVSIKLLKEASDILILPDCTLIPGIVKDECLPLNQYSGCAQDTTVKIVFNKPIIIPDYYSPLITDASGQNISECFGKPYLSADKTILYIPTSKERKILDSDSNLETKDVVVKIELSEIQDEEGIFGSGTYQHKYRVNRTRDTVNPVFTSAKLYTTSNKTSPKYKELSNKPFDSWSGSGANNGDFGYQHINNSVYVEVDGYDEDSGISDVWVKERILYNSAGTQENDKPVAKPLTCHIDEDTGLYCADYEISTVYDGIIELDFYVGDFANNFSTQSQKFYVLKDTMIDSGRIKFKQELGQFEDTPASWKENIPVIEGDEQTVVLTLSPTAKDYYFANYASDYEISAKWGYTENDIIYPVTRSGDTFTFTRNVNQLVFIKVFCKDEMGNEKEVIKMMAPRPEVDSSKDDQRDVPIYNLEIANLRSLLIQCNQPITSNAATCSSRIYRFYINQENPEEYIELYTYEEAFYGSDIGSMIVYADQLLNNQLSSSSTCRVEIFASSFIGDFPSPRSQNCIETSVENWSPITITQPSTSSIYNYSEIQNNFGPYLNETFNITSIEPILSSGCCKVTLDGYKKGNNRNVIYTIHAAAYTIKNYPVQLNVNEEMVDTDIYSYDPYVSTKSKTSELLLNSPNNYKFFIQAYDPETEILYSPYTYTIFYQYNDGAEDIIKNNEFYEEPDSYTFYVGEQTEGTMHLVLEKDLTPPEYLTDYNPFSYPGFYQITPPTDGNVETGQPQTVYKNKKGNYELDYYLIPNATNSIKSVPRYTISELENFYKSFKNTLEFEIPLDDNGTASLNIPYGNINEGFYTLSLVTKDIWGNTSVNTFACVNYLLGKLPYTLEYKFDWVPGPIFEDGVWVGEDPHFSKDYYYKFTLNNSKNPEIQAIQVNGQTNSTISIYTSNAFIDESTNTSGWGPTLIDILQGFSGNDSEDVSVTTQNGITTWTKRISSTPPGWIKLNSYYGTLDSDSVLGKGFYNTEYHYLGTDKTCDMINCTEGMYGLMIYSDNTVFVHTMYYPENLTESMTGSDAKSAEALALWETKGTETGVEFYASVRPNPDDPNNQTDPNGDPENQNSNSNSNYGLPYYTRSYGLDKIKTIPSGWYYTTIVRFANGAIIMTDVKQKD